MLMAKGVEIMRKSTLSFAAGVLVGAVIFGGGVAIAAGIMAQPKTALIEIDGKAVDLKGYLIEDAHYFQLRDLSASLAPGGKDFSIVWDGAGNRVIIDTSRGYDPNEQFKPQTSDTTPSDASGLSIKERITITPRDDGSYAIHTVGKSIPGKLANGKAITDDNITAMLSELEALFPDGFPWGDGDNGTYYSYWSGTFGLGGACNSWAGMTADLIWGDDAKYTTHGDLTKVRPGDIVQLKNKETGREHWFVVRGLGTSITGSAIIYICDGNVNGKVSWGDCVIGATIYDYPNSIVYTFHK